jgi:hypothetical protein
MRANAPAALSAALCLLAPVALGQSAPPPGPPPEPPPEYGTSQAPVYVPPPQYAPAPEPSLVRQNSVGLRLVIAPGVFIPTTGSSGFTLGVVVGYGLDLGPVIVTPAVMFQGSWASNLSIYSGLGGARVTLPLGNFGPFVEAALGYGNVSGALNYSKGGLEIRVGGGFIYFFSRNFALGLTVDYDTITDTPYQTWIFAPTIVLAF